MDNSAIVDALLEMAQVLEFLDENPFKAKAYERAARSISELAAPVEDLLDSGEISRIKGIGQAIAATLNAWVKDNDFSVLKDLQSRLPQGYVELLKVPGLGIKRLKTLHNDLGISTLDGLLEAIEAGKIASVRGFSDKSIAKLRGSVKAILDYRGWYLLDTAWGWATMMVSLLKECGVDAQITGVCRRSMEIVSSIDLLCEERSGIYDQFAQSTGLIPDIKLTYEGPALVVTCPGRPTVRIHAVPPMLIVPALFITTGSEAHVNQVNTLGNNHSIRISRDGVFKDEKPFPIRDEGELYGLLGMQYLPPEVREGRQMEIDLAISGSIPELIMADDLMGVIHVHTTYSDGRATLKDMVQGAYERGYSWIGISDHSKSAYYAGGMSIKTLKKQFEEIDALKNAFKGLTIFKGIESDILEDGSLDYPQAVLKQLDFVIASIHSHMDMDKAAMTERIIKALRNPFTTILGHPTGRVLLARMPYEVDMESVLTEAAGQGIIVELNANPVRLDLDWRLIPDFIAKGGRIVVAPDAHIVSGLDDMLYGISIARKGLLSRQACINCLCAEEAREAFKARWS